MSLGPNDEFDGRDPSGFASLYALDALEGEDLDRFEALLATDPDVAAEVAEFRRTAGRLATLTARPAPPELRDRVLGSLGDVRQEPPQIDVERRRRNRSTRIRRTASIAAASALIVGAGVAGFALGSDQGSGEVADGSTTSTTAAPTSDAVAEVLAFDDVAVSNMTGDTGVSARVLYSHTADRAVVVSPDLDAVPEDETYQLWQIHGDEAIPAGVFTPDDDGTVEFARSIDLDGADAVAVTIEPAGGSDAPTLPLVMSGELA